MRKNEGATEAGKLSLIGTKCIICKKPFVSGDMVNWDHTVPKQWGGKTWLVKPTQWDDKKRTKDGVVNGGYSHQKCNTARGVAGHCVGAMAAKDAIKKTDRFSGQNTMRKIDINHDEKGRFSGGASMRQGTGKSPTTHSQTRGEVWYRMGAKDKADAEVLGRKHAAADYHAKAYEAIHDSNNPEHRIKLAALKSKAEGLADQLAVAQPNQDSTTRTFKQQVPKRGKAKHDKLMASLVTHIHATKDSALANGKKNGLIPEGTHPKMATKAYHHGALIAMHRSGVGKYDWNMNSEDKVHMKHLKKFILYTHRRLFDEFHSKHKGEFKVYHDQFGEPFSDHRKDKDGNERKRFSPLHEVIKFESGDLQKMLPEYDRACAMANSYGPKLLHSIKKELKSSIKENEASESKIAPGLKKGIASWIGGAIGGLAGGAATDGVGAEEGASIGSKIGGGIGDLFSGAKAAFQGSRASEGIGAVIRGAKAVAAPVVSQAQKFGATDLGGRAKSFASNMSVKADKIGHYMQHPAQNVGRSIGGKIGGFPGKIKGASIGKSIDRKWEFAQIPVQAAGVASFAAKRNKQPQQQNQNPQAGM